MSTDPAAAARERLNRIVTEVNRDHERYIAVRAGIEKAEATESTDGGAITVTVGSAGELRDLKLTDGALQLDAARLGVQVVAATKRAQARIADRVQEIVAENVPSDDLLGRQIVAKTRERFPDPEPEPTHRPAQADPEDFSTQSYLK
ncbi:YbaB/EbfC family nucleoid-associated protein [Amycolatopsis sp.]|uniref:YbaB/EbfC family nucleoid-associated protein n=1 Tax=Amycolatopsis sp. TaxID=37632 RepID=UPI002C97E210|nr:YbaB/EbfC family nucleoid-associated protein [Amycolatopsis sp.]HVV14124.1 YbaB/EbfC family nucleoid-associated protein [Amycolatopsis sp.]